MQSKQNLTKQTTLEANGVVFPHADLLPDLNAEEIRMIVSDYQNDNYTKICPQCSAEVSSDNLVYIEDQTASWDESAYGHTECPHCEQEVGSSDLEKPTFDYWLKLTA